MMTSVPCTDQTIEIIWVSAGVGFIFLSESIASEKRNSEKELAKYSKTPLTTQLYGFAAHDPYLSCPLPTIQ